MNIQIRTYVYIALAILLALILWRAAAAIHADGMADERAVWIAAQADADAEAEAQRRAAQAVSDSVTDETRAGADKATQDAMDETTTTIERIRYVYRDQPAADCPAVPVPDGVQQELRAAYDAARAAAR